MDGWMDGWMKGWADECRDGEVLIIGMMVGWSGGVPKCLVSVKVRTWSVIPGGFFFSTYFRKGFWSDFFDFLWILEGF